MRYRKAFLRRASRLAFVSLLAGALAACQKNGATASNTLAPPGSLATLPLSNAPTSPTVPAPPLTSLPPYPIQTASLAQPSEDYALADRAYAQWNGFADAPPDYAFDYGGVRPWAWSSGGGYMTVVEPLTGGGDRYYYYGPGADAPYFVRDPNYGYGYQNGLLVVVYDRYGHVLSGGEEAARADSAGRYWWRGQNLWRAARHGPHYGVAQANWDNRRQRIYDARNHWSALRDQNPDWRAYHDQHARQEAAVWSQTRARREAEGPNGPPPPAYGQGYGPQQGPGYGAPRQGPKAVGAAALTGGGDVRAAMLAAHRHGSPSAGPAAPVPAPPAAQARDQVLAARRAQMAAHEAQLQAQRASSAAETARARQQATVLAQRQAQLRAQQASTQQVAARAQAELVARQADLQRNRVAETQRQAAARAAAQATSQRAEQARMAARQAQLQQQLAAQAQRQAQARAKAEAHQRGANVGGPTP